MRIVKIVWRRIRRADIEVIAGSLSYTTVLSLVPLLAVSLSVFQLLGGVEHLMKQVEPFILKNLAVSSGVHLSHYLAGTIRRSHSSALGITGILGLLISSTKLFTDMDRAIHRVWLIRKRKSWIKKLLVYWVVMFTGPLILAIVLGAVGSKGLGFSTRAATPFLFSGFVFIALVTIYKWVPSRKVDLMPTAISAFVATIGLFLTQEFYAVIVRSLFKFSKIYGSLAGVPLFLIWVFVVWWIILMGATLTALLQERRDMTSIKLTR